MNLQDAIALLPQIFLLLQKLENRMSLLAQSIEELLSLQNQLIAQKTPSSSAADLLDENAKLKQQVSTLTQEKVTLAGENAADDDKIKDLQKEADDAKQAAQEAQDKLKAAQDAASADEAEHVALQAKIAAAATRVAQALKPSPVVVPQQDVPVDQSEHQQAAVEQAAENVQHAAEITPQNQPDGTVVTASNQPVNPATPVLNALGSGAVDSPTSSTDPITSANQPDQVESTAPNSQPNDTQTVPLNELPVETTENQ